MGSVAVQHVFDVDVDTFWGKVFFDEEYNRVLYTDKLAFRRYDRTDKTHDDGSVERELITEPNTKMPGPVQKVIGETITYTEIGKYDAASGIYSFQIVPPSYREKIKIQGKLWVEPAGEGKVTRFFEMDCSVKIFGVGKLVESSIEKTTAQSHEIAAAYTREFIAQRQF